MTHFLPVLLNPGERTHLRDSYSPDHITDIYRDLLFEEYLASDPKLYFASLAVQQKKFNQYYRLKKNAGIWLNHPWSKKMYHLLTEDAYYRLRTLRNRNLLSIDEQSRLH